MAFRPPSLIGEGALGLALAVAIGAAVLGPPLVGLLLAGWP